MIRTENRMANDPACSPEEGRSASTSELASTLAPHGLIVIGHREQLTLIGNAGSAMWHAFQTACRNEPDPLDAWTRRTINPIARRLGAMPVYPFERPHRPFLRWARELGCAFATPMGLAIHPAHGTWHAYRAALLWPKCLSPAVVVSSTTASTTAETKHDLPTHADGPCEGCTSRPCLSACPVGAFDGSRYDEVACREHLRSVSGAACRDRGCLARNACPIGARARYEAEHAAFHMQAFHRSEEAADR